MSQFPFLDTYLTPLYHRATETFLIDSIILFVFGSILFDFYLQQVSFTFDRLPLHELS
jgi:hypothetical protein